MRCVQHDQDFTDTSNRHASFAARSRPAPGPPSRRLAIPSSRWPSIRPPRRRTTWGVRVRSTRSLTPWARLAVRPERFVSRRCCDRTPIRILTIVERMSRRHPALRSTLHGRVAWTMRLFCWPFIRFSSGTRRYVRFACWRRDWIFASCWWIWAWWSWANMRTICRWALPSGRCSIWAVRTGAMMV